MSASSVLRLLKACLVSMGYSEIVALPDPMRKKRYWFQRKGLKFESELLAVSHVKRSDGEFIDITFFGSPFTVDELRKIGLVRNVIASNLFYHLVGAGHDASTLLPASIDVSSSSDTSKMSQQISTQVEVALTSVYDVLWEKWRDDEDTGVTNA